LTSVQRHVPGVMCLASIKFFPQFLFLEFSQKITHKLLNLLNIFIIAMNLESILYMYLPKNTKRKKSLIIIVLIFPKTVQRLKLAYW